MLKHPLKISGLALLAAGSFLTVSCNKSGTTEQARELHSGIIRANMDTTVAPGDNFTAYVNGNWVKKTAIPADKATYGVFHILNDKAQEDVKAIIEASAKGEFAEGTEEQKIGSLYESYLDTKKRDELGIKPLEPEFQKIAAINNYKDLAAYFAYANKYSNLVPMNVQVTEDFKNPKQYMLLTWQGGLGLPEREYYLLTDAKSKDIRAKYVAHIEKMLTLAGIADAKAKAAQIMALETQLATKHM
ncbi:MAG: M13 family peptidase, partial [Adhaeribacter sp.]